MFDLNCLVLFCKKLTIMVIWSHNEGKANNGNVIVQLIAMFSKILKIVVKHVSLNIKPFFSFQIKKYAPGF